MLELLKEGQVYELLLVSKSNVTPVGVVRKGETLHFKLFPGKSFKDLLENNRTAIQITWDAELLVRTALNLSVSISFESSGGHRWISSLPGWLGKVECRREVWKDEIGTAEVLRCEFFPERRLPGELTRVPFSRADCVLVEMAVLFTRYIVRPSPEQRNKILDLYSLYRHLGGTSDTAEYIVGHLKGA
ncbi:hypothetical protein A3L09_08840 [Thermococcus profundus]|uniref:DUF447 domain-containing protein n=1 Tax=Thermococcus profundus TaxID=49899 RepID=A0A2Z2MHD4_THEPR|nr:DUF447 domain-containing protein [Thermococcus profundus]ASJ03354.1 hypothetical protein A3L09_08840 [Thermococcus profundus]